jgi:hypothetical protein
MLNEENTLAIIQKETLTLGYNAQFIEEFNELPFKVLLVYPFSTSEKPELKEWALNLTVFPMGDDLDGSVFVQIYWEYNLKANESNTSLISEKLIEANFKLPLGSLGISPETSNIYYRLVMPLAFDTTITAAYLADVYDMVMYPMEAYYKEFAEYVKA